MKLAIVSINKPENKITYVYKSMGTSARFTINTKTYELIEITEINMNINDIEFISEAILKLKNEIKKLKKQ